MTNRTLRMLLFTSSDQIPTGKVGCLRLQRSYLGDWQSHNFRIYLDEIVAFE